MRWVIGKWEGEETVPLPSPAPPHCFFNFGAIAPLWLQLLLDCFSFHDPAPARYPLLYNQCSLGSPGSWNLVTVPPPVGSPSPGIIVVSCWYYSLRCLYPSFGSSAPSVPLQLVLHIQSLLSKTWHALVCFPDWTPSEADSLPST